MPLTCRTQYDSKFGRLSSGHRTGKGQFSSQSQRKAMPKKAQSAIQLHSFHTLPRWDSKSFQLCFSSTWTKNFQMYKLDLEKAEEPETKLPTSVGSSKKQEFQKNIYFCYWLYQNLLLCDHNRLWKILKEMGIPEHLSCLLRNLYAGQEATIRTGHETTDWLQTGKGVCQGYILSPCLFNLYTAYIMRNARLDEAQAGIKTARRNINNLVCEVDTTLMTESKEELESLLMKVKEESEKAGLKVNIQKPEVMASGPIISWQIYGETMETVRYFIFSGVPESLQLVTAAMKLKDACSLEEKLWPI